MRRQAGYLLLAAVLLLAAPAAWSATFGRVIPIGGHVADIALDERRGVIYAANFTANRIEVISTSDYSRRNPIFVSAQPGALALSPDGRYLVVGHYAAWEEPITREPSITVIDLDSGSKRALALGKSPLAMAFGNGSSALIATTGDFRLLNPATGGFTILEPQGMQGEPLPVPFATFPPEILKASAGVSGDGRVIYIVAQTGQEETECPPEGGEGEEQEPCEPKITVENVILRYDVVSKQLLFIGITSSPPLGPRVISVDQNGSNFLAGWAMFNSRAVLLAQFPKPGGEFEVGSHAFDSSRNLIYGHIPTVSGRTEAPVLTIFDSDNLTLRERLRLRESLAGKSILTSDKNILYAASDSGVTALPIGQLAQFPRVTAAQEDLVFRTNACDRRLVVQQLDVVDPGGGATDFVLSTAARGVRITPSSGVTPARVSVEVDPTVYQNQKGTTAIELAIASKAAVNIPMPVRLLVNTREPDQRGAFINVPGKLVDLMADPVRNRFYVLRQDKNLVLIFDAASFEPVAALRTGNTPVQMAMTRDNRFLIVTNDNSQIANVYNLDTLQPQQYIEFPHGHYPRSIAVSKKAILATVRSVSGPHAIDQVEFDARIANTLPSLGIYRNEIDPEMTLAVSPSGEYVLAASADGNLLLYEATANTFVASRQDFAGLGGAIGALTDETFAVDNNLVNWSLVPVGQIPTSTGATSGFVFVDGLGVRTMSPSPASPGVIERVDLATLESLRPTSMVESPLLAESMISETEGQIGQAILPFTRTLVALPNRQSIISLSTSGFVVLPWDFDAAVAPPVVSSIVNTADQSPAVAPGGLVAISGINLSAVTVVNKELPVPTTLGEVCVTVNNVPMPLFMVSPSQINAQLPFNTTGSGTLVVRAAGGISPEFAFTILQGAAAIFRSGTAGPDTGIATVVRATNNELVTLTNPIHPKDYIVIYATGLGDTAPAIQAGDPAPGDPLAAATFAPKVSLGGVQLEIGFAGLVPGQVGVYQINAFVPEKVPEGMSVPLKIEQGTYSTTLSVRVVK